MVRFFSAGDWARRLYGPRFRSGELGKREFVHRQLVGLQSWVLNTRRPLLRDIRVREALGLAVDFDWMSRQIFMGPRSATTVFSAIRIAKPKDLPARKSLPYSNRGAGRFPMPSTAP